MIDLKRLLRYGFPGPVHDISNGSAFTSCYDRRMRNPSWVIECIRKKIDIRWLRKSRKSG